jgi:hypothetical protein
MSSWRRKASDRIETQREAGRKIQKRIENLRGKDQATLPRSAWVSGEELQTWRATGRQLIEELFGAGSEESLRWEELWRTEPASSPYDRYPEDYHLNRLAYLQAYLEGLKASPALSRNAVERARDWVARHPVLGIVIAGASALGTVFGVVRGVAWLISLL